MVKLRVGLAVLITAIAFLGGCGTSEPPDSAVPNSPKPSPANSAFAKIDQESKELISAEAKWQAPSSLTVDTTQRVGLSIGEGDKIADKINTLLPSTSPITAGVVEVGPTVRATLFATEGDADVSPSVAMDASTGSNIQMLWTWLVKPKRPTDRLTLTAHLEVPLSDGHVVSNDLSLTLAVKRTALYTLTEIATHWGTWSGVGASIVGIVGWFTARARRRKRASQPAAS
ncbi:hypothetical protein [Rhizocola hellebori]|uniref:hypothetical protein n=1 Tax=Rhizocola hellebori TaxID=1392758 RepID=UPI0019454414|nr:hypothetical protein [Rhizocola hellebori]